MRLRYGRLLLVAIFVAGLAACHHVYWWDTNLHRQADESEKLTYVDQGVLEEPNCRVEAEDGSFTFATGAFTPPRQPMFRVAWSTEGINDSVNWPEQWSYGISVPVRIVKTDANETFHGRLLLAALPQRFQGTPAFAYKISFPPAAWAAAKNGGLAFAAGALKWGWPGEAVTDRIVWQLVFSRAALPRPVSETDRLAYIKEHFQIDAPR